MVSLLRHCFSIDFSLVTTLDNQRRKKFVNAYQIRRFLNSLSQEQRDLISHLLIEERHSAIFDVLQVLSTRLSCGMQLSYNGEFLPEDGLSGMGVSGDYTGRCANWNWPY